MADYLFGLSISSFIALFLGINRKWRVASKNGLYNSLTLLVVLIVSFVIFGEIYNKGSSNAFLGLLGIITFPSYIIIRATLRHQSRKNKTHKPASFDEPPKHTGEDEHSENVQLAAPAKIKPTNAVPKTQAITETPHATKGNRETTALTKKQHPVKDEGFPDWHVSISFGRSRSENFPQALGLARMAPKYLEHTVEGRAIHQSVFSSKPTEYLAFVKLYELVSSWKSCFVVINGQMVDRKIVGGLNYCYGDRCRSGNPEFCYGASYMTENPFGCHRIQISACNNPWWTFGKFNSKGIWLVDKKTMLKRILEYSEPYRLCPAFSIDSVLEALKNLPDNINPKKDKNWIAAGSMIAPAGNQSALEFTIRLNLIGPEGGTHLD